MQSSASGKPSSTRAASPPLPCRRPSACFTRSCGRRPKWPPAAAAPPQHGRLQTGSGADTWGHVKTSALFAALAARVVPEARILDTPRRRDADTEPQAIVVGVSVGPDGLPVVANAPGLRRMPEFTQQFLCGHAGLNRSEVRIVQNLLPLDQHLLPIEVEHVRVSSERPSGKFQARTSVRARVAAGWLAQLAHS